MYVCLSVSCSFGHVANISFELHSPGDFKANRHMYLINSVCMSVCLFAPGYICLSAADVKQTDIHTDVIVCRCAIAVKTWKSTQLSQYKILKKQIYLHLIFQNMLIMPI